MVATARFWIDTKIFLRQALCYVMFTCLRKLSLKRSNSLTNEFEKWRAIRASVGGLLAWVT